MKITPVNCSPRFHLICIINAVMSAALLVLTSCSSSPSRWNSKTSFSPSAYQSQNDFGGEVVTDSTTTTALVVSVDHTNRLVELKRADGPTITYKALPGARGFDSIQAGDQVKVAVAEDLAVYIGRNSVPASSVGDNVRLHIRLPDGTLVAADEVGTLVYSGKIVAINDWEDKVTLQLTNGRTKTIKVGEFVNLADFNAGDAVSVKATEAAVLLVDKP